MPDSLLLDKRGPVWIATLNRPERKNALLFESFEALEQVAREAAGDAELRALILTGTGPVFSSGMDLAALAEMAQSGLTLQGRRAMHARLQATGLALERLEVPTVAAIEGVCLGGGLELALACDLRVVGEGAQLGLPETRVGLLPDLGGTTRLARVVGPARAKEIIFTARRVGADEALAIGLAHRKAAAGKAMEAALGLVEEIMKNAPISVGWAKRVVDRGFGKSIQEGLELEQDAMSEIFATEDLREGAMSFLEKRAPKWGGK